MNIKLAVQWSEHLTKEKREIYCILSCNEIGVYIVVKKSELSENNIKKVVYTAG